AVDDGALMALAGFNPEQLRVISAGWVAADLDAIADRNRIGRIKTDYTVVLHKNTGHAISRGRNNERIIKPQFQWPRRHLPVPIQRPMAQAQMPFANAGR